MLVYINDVRTSSSKYIINLLRENHLNSFNIMYLSYYVFIVVYLSYYVFIVVSTGAKNLVFDP